MSFVARHTKTVHIPVLSPCHSCKWLLSVSLSWLLCAYWIYMRSAVNRSCRKNTFHCRRRCPYSLSKTAPAEYFKHKQNTIINRYTTNSYIQWNILCVFQFLHFSQVCEIIYFVCTSCHVIMFSSGHIWLIISHFQNSRNYFNSSNIKH